MKREWFGAAVIVAAVVGGVVGVPGARAASRPGAPIVATYASVSPREITEGGVVDSGAGAGIVCVPPSVQMRPCTERDKAVARGLGECDLVKIDIAMRSCSAGTPPSGTLVISSPDGFQFFNVADLIDPDGVARWSRVCIPNPDAILLLSSLGTTLEVRKECCACGPEATCCCMLPPEECDWSRNVCDCIPPWFP